MIPGTVKAQLRGGTDCGLIPLRMTYWLRTITSIWQRLFKPRQGKVDRSTLVGMYLSQANNPFESNVRGSGTRERQEGKFSQNRRRG